LGLYTGIAPDKIVFGYGAHGKPYLQDNPDSYQFNVSHSADLAIFALTVGQEIGVDIEKMEPYFKEKIAKRFFNPQEYNQLMTLSENDRVKGFYQIWSRKEALVKTLGQGLFAHLADFSVNLSQDKESFTLDYLEHHYSVTLQSVSVSQNYQAAVATIGSIKNIIYKRC
jgi:4'-phosphopantetheinyl transferase